MFVKIFCSPLIKHLTYSPHIYAVCSLFIHFKFSNGVDTLSNQQINALVSSEFILLRVGNIQMQTKKLRDRTSTGKFEHVISQLTEVLVKVKSITKVKVTQEQLSKICGGIKGVDICNSEKK